MANQCITTSESTRDEPLCLARGQQSLLASSRKLWDKGMGLGFAPSRESPSPRAGAESTPSKELILCWGAEAHFVPEPDTGFSLSIWHCRPGNWLT